MVEGTRFDISYIETAAKSHHWEDTFLSVQESQHFLRLGGGGSTRTLCTAPWVMGAFSYKLRVLIPQKITLHCLA